MVLKNAKDGISLDNDLRVVQKYAAEGAAGRVRASVSSATHRDAWENLGHDADSTPIAFQVDQRVYVDMSRWPSTMEPLVVR
jgi:hypothetical protein